jgi:hypothetical protein
MQADKRKDIYHRYRNMTRFFATLRMRLEHMMNFSVPKVNIWLYEFTET